MRQPTAWIDIRIAPCSITDDWLALTLSCTSASNGPLLLGHVLSNVLSIRSQKAASVMWCASQNASGIAAGSI